MRSQTNCSPALDVVLLAKEWLVAFRAAAAAIRQTCLANQLRPDGWQTLSAEARLLRAGLRCRCRPPW